jgi:hypothetical protein
VSRAIATVTSIKGSAERRNEEATESVALDATTKDDAVVVLCPIVAVRASAGRTVGTSGSDGEVEGVRLTRFLDADRVGETVRVRLTFCVAVGVSARSGVLVVVVVAPNDALREAATV